MYHSTISKIYKIFLYVISMNDHRTFGINSIYELLLNKGKKQVTAAFIP